MRTENRGFSVAAGWTKKLGVGSLWLLKKKPQRKTKLFEIYFFPTKTTDEEETRGIGNSTRLIRRLIRRDSTSQLHLAEGLPSPFQNLEFRISAFIGEKQMVCVDDLKEDISVRKEHGGVRQENNNTKTQHKKKTQMNAKKNTIKCKLIMFAKTPGWFFQEGACIYFLGGKNAQTEGQRRPAHSSHRIALHCSRGSRRGSQEAAPPYGQMA